MYAPGDRINGLGQYVAIAIGAMFVSGGVCVAAYGGHYLHLSRALKIIAAVNAAGGTFGLLVGRWTRNRLLGGSLVTGFALAVLFESMVTVTAMGGHSGMDY